MKILSRLSCVSAEKELYVLTPDEKDFYTKDMVSFADESYELLYSDPKKAAKLFDETFTKTKNFFDSVHKALKSGKKIGLSAKGIDPFPISEDDFAKRTERFMRILQNVQAALGLYFSIDVGDTVETTLNKLKKAFKDKIISNSFDPFSEKWFWDEYNRFYDKADGVHTLKFRGANDLYLQFKDDELIRKYY